MISHEPIGRLLMEIGGTVGFGAIAARVCWTREAFLKSLMRF